MNIPIDLLAKNVIELQVQAYNEGYEAGLKEGAKRATISVTKIFEEEKPAEFINDGNN